MIIWMRITEIVREEEKMGEMDLRLFTLLYLWLWDWFWTRFLIFANSLLLFKALVSSAFSC